MAEITGAQIDALTDALGKLESRLASSGSSGQSGGGGGGSDVDLSGVSKGIKSAATGFTGALTTGSFNLTELTKSTSGIMKVIPGLGNAFQALTVGTVKYLETSQASFNALAKAGGGFQGNLGELNRAAAATRLPLDQFTGLIANNSQALTALGGGVNEGSRRFAELSAAMFEGGTIDAFMNLGMTLEESNEFLMDSISLQRRSAIFQSMSDKERVAAAAEMAKSFDTLAKLTGKQAKDIKDELMERQNAGATQARLRLLEKQGVKGATDAYNAAQKGLAGAPSQLRNLVDDLVQTGVPMSKATANFAATNKEAFALAKQIAEATKRGDATETARLSKEASAKSLEFANSERGLTLATLSQVSDIAQGQADALQEVGTTIDALNENAKRMQKSTGELATTSESYANLIKRMAADTEQQVSLSEKNQQALKFVNQAQQGIANASKVARDGIAGAVETNDTFTTILGNAAEAINKTFDPVQLNAIAEALSDIGSVANTKIEAGTVTGDPNSPPEEVSKERRNIAEGVPDKDLDQYKEGNKGIIGFFKDLIFGDDEEPSPRATGGTISPGSTYMVGERGPEIITESVGSVMNAAQTASTLDTGNKNASQDMSKLVDAMTTANDQLSTLIAINTRQTVLSDRQVKAIKGAGNLIKGV